MIIIIIMKAFIEAEDLFDKVEKVKKVRKAPFMISKMFNIFYKLDSDLIS